MDSYLLFAWFVLLSLLFMASALIVWTVAYLAVVVRWVWRLR